MGDACQPLPRGHPPPPPPPINQPSH
jgi:hypothetical protein